MNKAALKAARDAKGLKPVQRYLLRALASVAEGEIATPGIVWLAKEAGVFERTAQRQLRKLADMGLIEIRARRSDRGDPTSNEYRLFVARWCQNDTTPSRQNDTTPGVTADTTMISGSLRDDTPNPSHTSLDREAAGRDGIDVDELTRQLRSLAKLPLTGKHFDRDRCEVAAWLGAGLTAEQAIRLVAEREAASGEPTASLKRWGAEARRLALAAPPAPIALPSIENQRIALQLFVAGSLHWEAEQRAAYGEPPGRPGCRMAPELLAEFGFGERRAA